MTRSRPTYRGAISTSIAVIVASLVVVRPALASPWSIRTDAAESRAAPDSTGLRRPEIDEDSSADATRREAAAAFADGEAAFERAEYGLAASRFEHAHRLSPHQWTLYNLALSRARAGDALGAWRAFDALADGATTDAERREAERERDALVPLLAVVVVRGPFGARGCIDDVPVVLGAQRPLVRVVLPGIHRITTSARDEDIAIDAGSRVDVDATPRSGPRDAVRPWLLAATVASSVAIAGAAAGAVTASTRTTQGLAGAAAVAGGVALTAAIVALVRRSREQRTERSAFRCAAPDQKRPRSVTPAP